MSEASPPARSFGLPRSALARGALFLALGAGLQIAVGLAEPASHGPEIVLTEADVHALEAAFVKRTGLRVDPEIRARLVAQEVDDRLLVAEARRRGWHRTDPVVQRRLVQNQRFLGADPEASEQAVLDLAYEQGMDRSDVVVRRRLIERVRLAVAEASRREGISEAELENYRAQHPDLFRRAPRVTLAQVFLSRDRRGPMLARDAQAMADRIANESPTPEEALTWADPSLLPQTLSGATEDELARHFGVDFARAAEAAEIGTWTGPIESPFGLHFVQVTQRLPAFDPPLAEIEASVLGRVQRQREDEAMRVLLRRLRSEARIETPLGGA
jgi:hypothetical protein